MVRALAMIASWSVLVAGCEVRSTVGFNARQQQALDGGGVEGGIRNNAGDGGTATTMCPQSSPLATCSTGTCTVKVASDTYPGNVSIAVDDENIFYRSAEQAISRRSLDGGAATELTSTDFMLRLAADDTHVFWTEQNGRVRAVPKAGGVAFDVASVFGNPLELAVEATHVYWVIPEFGEVAMAPKAGGAPSHIVGHPRAQTITFDAQHVYWGNGGEGDKAGQIARAPLGNLSGAEVLLSNLDAPVSIAVTDTFVVWGSMNAVFRTSKSSVGSPVEITSGLTEVKELVVFGDTIYGAGMDGFWKVPVAGGPRTLLDKRPMSAIALNCSGVYASSWFEPVLLRYAP